jgi:hypothetical protein
MQDAEKAIKFPLILNIPDKWQGWKKPKRFSGYNTQMIFPDLVQNKLSPKVQTARMQEILSPWATPSSAKVS